MKRYFLIAATIWTAIFGMLPGHAAKADASLASPQERIEAFYRWYIRADSGPAYPLLDDRINAFVSADTVKQLRDDYRNDNLPGGVEYFLKVQDYDARDWMHHIDMGAPLELDGVLVVPVTFGSKDKTSILVFMRKLDGEWKITKVDDLLDYK